MLELLVSTMLYPPPGPPEARRFIPRLLPISSERPPLGNPEAALLNALTAFLYPLATRPFGEPVSVILPATPPFISGGPVFIVPVRLLDFLVPKKEGTS
jgi:hypothetical protein